MAIENVIPVLDGWGDEIKSVVESLWDAGFGHVVCVWLAGIPKQSAGLDL